MTLNWLGSSSALRRCAISGMALTPSSQQLMSRLHRNQVTTIPSPTCRTLVLSSILGRTSGEGNANYFRGTHYGNQPSLYHRAGVQLLDVINNSLCVWLISNHGLFYLIVR